MKTLYIRTNDDILPKAIKKPDSTYDSILYEMNTPFNPERPLSRFWLQCHSCGVVGNLGSHDEVSVNDGVVTISPSLQCSQCPAHYFIKNGEVIK